MTAMIEGDNIEFLTQGLKRAEPIESAGDRPPVQQDDGGRVGRAGHMVDIGGAAARQFECLPRREWRATD